MAKVMTNRGWLAAFAAAILCLGALGLSSTAQAASVTNATIGSATVAPNGDVTVNLTISGDTVGSYGVNIQYDTLVTPTSCTSAEGVCNVAFPGATNTVRINGSKLSGGGISGTNVVIGSITFHAGATLGVADLDITAADFSDTVGEPLTVTPTDGTITIANVTPSPSPSPTAPGGTSGATTAAATTAAALPKTGGPSSDSSFQLGWLAAATGALIVVAAGAWTFARAREDS